MDDLKNIKFDFISLNSLSDIKEFGFKREPYIFSDKDLNFMETTLTELKNKILSHSPFYENNKLGYKTDPQTKKINKNYFRVTTFFKD